jgi:hypothetical protein
LTGELNGKIAGQRVIRRHHFTELTIERSTESKGKIFGMDVSFITTVKSRERHRGGMYVEGNGIMMT